MIFKLTQNIPYEIFIKFRPLIRALTCLTDQ